MLGAVGVRREQLQAIVAGRVTDLGLSPGAVNFIDEKQARSRDIRAPTMAIFFGGRANAIDTTLVAELIDDSVKIAPLASSLTQVQAEIPPQLQHVNVLEVGEDGAGLERVATLVLETFRLLRRERRLFISYRRVDAQPFANRLYDALDARGFDVFIDVRSVPPAEDFQSELWHRLCDSDVVVLIDTPGFRDSRWTREELAKANATNVQILHLLWPGQQEDSASSFSHFFKLTWRDFMGFWPRRGGWVRRSTLARICDEAEKLRARAMAARNRYLVDNFCDAARDLGAEPAVQPESWISLSVPGTVRSLVVVPAVGVPTSDRINEIFDDMAGATLNNSDIWIIYDNRGVLESWLTHLDWLDKHLPLRTIRMAQAPDFLRRAFK